MPPLFPDRFKAHGEITVSAGGAPSNGIGKLTGIISSETRDADGEIALQNGLRFDYFLQRGWFNDNHEQGAGAGVAIPTRCEIIRLPSGVLATRVEGYFVDTDRAREIMQLGIAAQKSGRPLGFSLEGPVLRREGPDKKILAEALVRDCAIARHPKNPDTASLDVIYKALTAGYGGPAGAPGTGAAYVPQSLDGARPASAAWEPELSEQTALRQIMRRLNCSEAHARTVLAAIRRNKGVANAAHVR